MVNLKKTIFHNIDLFYIIYSLIIFFTVCISLFSNILFYDGVIDLIVIIFDIILILSYIVSYILRFLKKKHIMYLIVSINLLIYSILLVSITAFYYSVAILGIVLSICMIYIIFEIETKIKKNIILAGVIAYIIISICQTLKIMSIYRNQLENDIITFIITLMMIFGIYNCIRYFLFIKRY